MKTEYVMLLFQGDFGQIWNAASLAQSLGVSEPTVRRYLDFLSQTFRVRQLPAWYENVGKRQVKAPKIYFLDTGFLHALLMRGSQRIGVEFKRSDAPKSRQACASPAMI